MREHKSFKNNQTILLFLSGYNPFWFYEIQYTDLELKDFLTEKQTISAGDSASLYEQVETAAMDRSQIISVNPPKLEQLWDDEWLIHLSTMTRDTRQLALRKALSYKAKKANVDEEDMEEFVDAHLNQLFELLNAKLTKEETEMLKRYKRSEDGTLNQFIWDEMRYIRTSDFTSLK